MSKNDEVLKIVNLLLIHELKESYNHLKTLHCLVRYYQNKIEYLENSKPFFFQKNKLADYNKKMEEYKLKIFDTYKKIDFEINLICQMEDNIQWDVVMELQKRNKEF